MIALILELVIAFYIANWVYSRYGLFWGIITSIIIMSFSNSAYPQNRR